MTIHKEGTATILVSLIALGAISAATLMLSNCVYVSYTVTAVCTIVFLTIVNFFRSPKRICKATENTIIAPCDGKVVVIEEVYEPECLKQQCIQVSIFMSPLNVHVNWFPMNGVVKFVTHHAGRFMGAYLPKSSTENERSTVHIQNSAGKEIVVRQVAGAMARRIVCYAQNDQQATQGKQMGFIKFGSRIDLYLPLDAKIKVDINQKTKGTETLIAEL